MEKKHNLESIVESSSSTPQNDLTLMSPQSVNMANTSCGYVNYIASGGQSQKKRKSLRRSYSHNDLKNIILAQEDDDEDDNNYYNEVFYDNNNIQNSSGIVRLNETFELNAPQSTHKINISSSQFTSSHIQNGLIPLYDLNASNDSLMNNGGPMSSSLSQSLDSLKINEVSCLSDESKLANTTDKIANALQAACATLLDLSEISALMNGTATKLVANDCNAYMQLSNKLNELNKIHAKLKESLVLKKV